MVRFCIGLFCGLIIGVLLFRQAQEFDWEQTEQAVVESPATLLSSDERIQALQHKILVDQLVLALKNSDYETAIDTIESADAEFKTGLQRVWEATLRRWLLYDLEQAQRAASALAFRDPYATFSILYQAQVDIASGRREQALLRLRSALLNPRDEEDRAELQRAFTQHVQDATELHSLSGNAQALLQTLDLLDRPTAALLHQKAHALFTLDRCNQAFAYTHKMAQLAQQENASVGHQGYQTLTQAYTQKLLDHGYERRTLKPMQLKVTIQAPDGASVQLPVAIRGDTDISLLELSSTQAQGLGLAAGDASGVWEAKELELAGLGHVVADIAYVITDESEKTVYGFLGLEVLKSLGLCLDSSAGHLYIKSDGEHEHSNSR